MGFLEPEAKDAETKVAELLKRRWMTIVKEIESRVVARKTVSPER